MSRDDLDALIHIDSPPLTESTVQRDIDYSSQAVHYDILTNNREPFPSQWNTQQEEAASEIHLADIGNQTLPFHLSLPRSQSQTGGALDSIIITGDEVEQIELSDTGMAQEAPLNDVNSKEGNLMLSLLHCTPNPTAANNTFEQEFARTQVDLDFDFEFLSDLELNLSATGKNEKEAITTRSPGVDSSRRMSGTQRKETTKSLEILENVSPEPYQIIDSSTPRPLLRQDDSTLERQQEQATLPSMLHFSRSPEMSRGGSNQMLVSSPAAVARFTNSGQTIAEESQQHTAQAERTISPILCSDPQPAEPSEQPSRVPEHDVIAREELTAGSNSTSDASKIPAAVKQLYDIIRMQYSDFAFVYALSAQLCQDRVPMDCFVHLKIALLLSLASIGPNTDRPPIPIIGIGRDSFMTNYLMTDIGQLAARFVGPTGDVKPPGSGDKRHKWIEADPITLAKGGAFYVGDWSHLKMARADKLFQDIECSRISGEKGAQSLPLQAAIWGHWRSFKYGGRDQQTFNKLVKIFGIPIHVSDEKHDVLVDYLLNQYSVQGLESTVDHLSISREDMRHFLAVISKRTVDLSKEASLLLQKYFVASRAARPDCLTRQAFGVLKQFSESFAKLSLRHEVELIDAVAAIFMCENSIQNIFGSSADPPPTYKAHNFIGLVDTHLTEFQAWLQAYISQHCDA